VKQNRLARHTRPKRKEIKPIKKKDEKHDKQGTGKISSEIVKRRWNNSRSIPKDFPETKQIILQTITSFLHQNSPYQINMIFF